MCSGGVEPPHSLPQGLDLSLFQLGLRFLAYLLKEERPIPVEVQVTI